MLTAEKITFKRLQKLYTTKKNYFAQKPFCKENPQNETLERSVGLGIHSKPEHIQIKLTIHAKNTAVPTW